MGLAENTTYIRHRGLDIYDRADAIVDGDLERAAELHRILWDAAQQVRRLSFDTCSWPVRGYDKAYTLQLLAELAGPQEVPAADENEWMERAVDLLRAEELS